MLLGVDQIDGDTATETANILLKYQSDIAKAVTRAGQRPAGAKPFAPGPK